MNEQFTSRWRASTARGFGLILAGLILLIAVIYFAASRVLLAGYEQVEAREATQNADRLNRAFEGELSKLDALNLTWSSWDQAWNFVLQKDPKADELFRDSELKDASLEQLESNVIIFTGPRGNLVFARGYDLSLSKSLPLPEKIEAHLSAAKPILSRAASKNRTRGLLVLPQGILLTVSCPVMRSDGSGESHGSFILGRFLDEKVRLHLSDQVRLPVVVHGINDTKLPADFLQARSALSQGGELSFAVGSATSKASQVPVHHSLLNADTLSSYLLFKDLYGEPALIVRVDTPRRSYHQGLASIRLLLLALLSIGGVAAIISFFLHAALSRSWSQQSEDEELHRLLAHNSRDVLYVINLPTRLLVCYGDIKQALGGAESLNWDEWTERLHPDDRALREAALQGALNEGQAYNVEYRVRRDDGSYRYWLDRSRVLRAADDTPLKLVGACTDITERKKSETEKEVLLKEIHHRVKNNMQVISSMLNLQMGQIRDRPTLDMFRDSQNRIKTMALIHERLYQQNDLAAVDFAEYLRQLVNNLMRSYRQSPVNLELQLESVALEIDSAVPCGLIVNELVTNALKYAFQGRPDGRLTVSLRAEGPKSETVVLQVADDGVGFPLELIIEESESLGLQLVTALTEQLAGHIDVQRAPGTCWTLRFAAQNRLPDE